MSTRYPSAPAPAGPVDPVAVAAPRVAEQLSALLDGELPVAELALLLARSADGERATLARYALIQAALRDHAVGPAALDVADRVAAALDSSPLQAAAMTPALRSGSRPGWLASGLAAAVLVALAVLVGVAPGLRPSRAAMAPLATTLVPNTAGGLPADQLASYLVYHGEHSGSVSALLVEANMVNHRPAVAVLASLTP